MNGHNTECQNRYNAALEHWMGENARVIADRDAARADAERLANAIRDWWDEPGDGNADEIRAALAAHAALAARQEAKDADC